MPLTLALQVRKTLYDNADEETPDGQTIAQVADHISNLRANITIRVDNATAPVGKDEGITTNDVSAPTMLWLPCTGCLTKDSSTASLLSGLPASTAAGYDSTVGPTLTLCCSALQTTTIVPADANSLAFMRTPAEVLAIVSNFFPLGLNGNIK